jgi:asparagine synthase (glutamine-hydrolysing)
MEKKLINASQWQKIECGKKIIYSPNQSIIDFIKRNPNFSSFWQHTYTEFACIIYDTVRQKITAIRDHFGLEPCYYSYVNQQFIFGSTIPSVLQYIKAPPVINSSQITNLFFNKLFNAETYSDETYYQSINRLEPGHELHIDLNDDNGRNQKTSFWDLKQHNQTIYYSNKMDYVEHFAELLSEALRVQVRHEKKLAAEFSGGMDSSAIVACAIHNNMQPALFMHVSPPGSTIMDDMSYAAVVIKQMGIQSVNYVDATHFDLVETMLKYAQYFAGGAPYAGVVLANNIHSEIVKQGYKIVLSGIGGDECVSSHAPLNVCIPQLIKERGYKKAWHELHHHYNRKGYVSPGKLKQLIQFIKLSHPNFLSMMKQFGDINYLLKIYLKDQSYLPPPKIAPSLRDHEYNMLQGAASHHLRLRIEYNNVAAKALGFNYAYPLLYPKLIEYCYQLPLEQKRIDGVNRRLIRNYLGQFFPQELYARHSKIGAVTPATLEKIIMEHNKGVYNTTFHDLPFKQERERIQKRAKRFDSHLFIQTIPSFMFMTYWDSLS